MADAQSELDRIREADIANILAKVKAGKTLTATEDERLQKYYAAVDTRVADSMAAAAAMSAIPEKDLERAKAAGCPAFRGSRVYIGELVTWWKENGESLPTGNTELDLLAIEIQREKLRKIQFENAVQEGKYGEISKLVTRVEGLARELLVIVRRVLEDEAPRRLAGKSEEELRGLTPLLTDEICQLVEEKLKEWEKAK